MNATSHPVDILEEPSGLGGSIGKSFLFHVGVVGALAAWTVYQGNAPKMGSPDAQGGSVGVMVESSIPLPESAGRSNPLADDTTSELPRETEKQTKPDRQKEKEALEKLLERDLKQTSPKPRSTFKETREVAENQMRSPDSRVSSPLYGGSVGSGGIGARSSTFGNQFGAYVDVLQQRIASKWRPAEIDARVRTLPQCIVAFEILRDGRVQGLKVVQTSGNEQLDLTAMRAVTEASPFEPLPQGFQKSSAKMEVGFKLQR